MLFYTFNRKRIAQQGSKGGSSPLNSKINLRLLPPDRTLLLLRLRNNNRSKLARGDIFNPAQPHPSSTDRLSLAVDVRAKTFHNSQFSYLSFSSPVSFANRNLPPLRLHYGAYLTSFAHQRRTPLQTGSRTACARPGQQMGRYKPPESYSWALRGKLLPWQPLSYLDPVHLFLLTHLAYPKLTQLTQIVTRLWV